MSGSKDNSWSEYEKYKRYFAGEPKGSTWHKEYPPRDKSGRFMYPSTKFSSTSSASFPFELVKYYDRAGEEITHTDFVAKRKDRGYYAIASEMVGGFHVYTTWEGQHASGVPRPPSGKPLIFKTVIFPVDDPEDSMYVVRSVTEQDAILHHQYALRVARNSRNSTEDDAEEVEE